MRGAGMPYTVIRSTGALVPCCTLHMTHFYCLSMQQDIKLSGFFSDQTGIMMATVNTALLGHCDTLLQ